MSHELPGCHLMVALACEATPLIRHFSLQRCMEQRAFAIYRRDSLSLTVSGAGKTAMAAAVAYTAAALGTPQDEVWLNIGVAGSREHAVGSLFLGHKVVDRASGRSSYPVLLETGGLASESICTVDRPEPDYPDPGLYDMEAAGFIETASRFASLELVQLLKVVSDNPESASAELTAENLSELIDAAVPGIEQTVGQLRELAGELPRAEPWQATLAACGERWHLTHQQKRQLSELLSRWQVLSGEPLPAVAAWPFPGKTRQMLAWLQQQVDALPYRL